MRKYTIPYMIIEKEKPKIPFINIPNPIGTAIFIYENGMRKYVPFYYLQRLIRGIVKLIMLPFKLAMHYYMYNKYKDVQKMMRSTQK